jgi:hypothetical protein
MATGNSREVERRRLRGPSHAYPVPSADTVERPGNGFVKIAM